MQAGVSKERLLASVRFTNYSFLGVFAWLLPQLVLLCVILTACDFRWPAATATASSGRGSAMVSRIAATVWMRR